jgi:hypothetical protein
LKIGQLSIGTYALNYSSTRPVKIPSRKSDICSLWLFPVPRKEPQFVGHKAQSQVTMPTSQGWWQRCMPLDGTGSFRRIQLLAGLLEFYIFSQFSISENY